MWESFLWPKNLHFQKNKAKTFFFTLLMMSAITNAQVEKDTITIKNALEVKDSVVVKKPTIIQPAYLLSYLQKGRSSGYR